MSTRLERCPQCVGYGYLGFERYAPSYRDKKRFNLALPVVSILTRP